MLHQVLALAIAGAAFALILWGKWPRHGVALAAGGLMVGVVLLMALALASLRPSLRSGLVARIRL